MQVTTIKLDGVELKTPAPGPVWIQLAKPGHFKGHAAGPFTLDAKVFGDIIKNFQASANKRIPIDFEHASESDATSGSIPHKGAPAQGWIVDLEMRDGCLWGLVEWGALAREYIQAGQYKFFSPAIRFGSRDRVTGAPVGARMSSGAMTNNPFLDGMQPLAAKDAPGGEPAEGEADENPTARALRFVEAQYAIKLAEKEEELVTLREQVAARALQDATDDVRIAIETYADAKGITTADTEALLSVRLSTPAVFARLYPALAANRRYLLRDLTGGREGGVPTMAEGAAQQSVLGRAKQLMRDEGLSYEGALTKARAERVNTYGGR